MWFIRMGRKQKTTVPEKLTEICTAAEAATIRDMMVGVVSGGTGTAAAINGVTVAGQNGYGGKCHRL